MSQNHAELEKIISMSKHYFKLYIVVTEKYIKCVKLMMNYPPLLEKRISNV